MRLADFTQKFKSALIGHIPIAHDDIDGIERAAHHLQGFIAIFGFDHVNNAISASMVLTVIRVMASSSTRRARTLRKGMSHKAVKNKILVQ